MQVFVDCINRMTCACDFYDLLTTVALLFFHPLHDVTVHSCVLLTLQ